MTINFFIVTRFNPFIKQTYIMVNRRSFLKASGALALGSLVLPGCSGGADNTQQDTTAANDTTSQAPAKTAQTLSIGLQLYTVRDLIDQDLKGTLQKIAAMGYKDLESVGNAKGTYYGLKPKEFTSMVEDMGMKLRSSHALPGGQTKKEADLPATILTLKNNTQQLVDMAAETGQEYLVCSYLFPSEHSSFDHLKKSMAIINQAGEACKKAGIGFAFHNHEDLFETFDGKKVHEIFTAELDQNAVQYELDLYWATKAGQDPIEFFEKYPGRFPLWHVKDMAKTADKNFTEVGNGSIDFKRIFAQAQKAGMKYYFVEQDQTPGNALDSIAISYKNLSQLLA
jgi:sugar phosphate isomerase/epimerase